MDKIENIYKRYILLYVKGLGVGAANSVPGVSGGTIALITGILEELLDSFRLISPKNIKLFFTGKFKTFWDTVNGNFLLSVGLGIVTGLILLASIVVKMLNTYPVAIWSFFFGLIVISTISTLKTIRKFTIPVFIVFVAGAAIALLITIMPIAQTPDSLLLVFICGAVAICAMILPGISGAYILLLMGKYEYIINAVTDLKMGILAVFTGGAIIGLLSFSHFLSWLLRRYHDITISLLAGFMFGALNKVWPWKKTVDSVTEVNYLPSVDEHLFVGIASAAAAIAIFMTIEFLGNRKTK